MWQWYIIENVLLLDYWAWTLVWWDNDVAPHFVLCCSHSWRSVLRIWEVHPRLLAPPWLSCWHVLRRAMNITQVVHTTAIRNTQNDVYCNYSLHFIYRSVALLQLTQMTETQCYVMSTVSLNWIPGIQHGFLIFFAISSCSLDLWGQIENNISNNKLFQALLHAVAQGAACCSLIFSFLFFLFHWI